MTGKKNTKKDDEDGQGTVWDWKKDLDEWMDDVTSALPAGDGETIYPEKLSCKHGESDACKSVTQVLLGRAESFRRSGFYLPNSERWAVAPEEKVAIVDCGWGWMFTTAKGLRAAINEWAQDLVSTKVFSLQKTLSDKHGYAIFSVKAGVSGKNLPTFWFGRPKRAGGRYVLSGEKEGVQ